MVEEGNSPDGRPLVTIIGATGTGKSQLAVELARELRADADGGRAALWGGFKDAECVSADSMQMYSGLDVITNKATQQEMEGVKHHLMNFLEPGQSYDVGSFVGATRSLCEDMWTRSRPTLPIVVGGTTYYIQHLLFPGRLVFTSRAFPPQHWDENGSEDLRDRFPNLPEQSLALLQALDSSAPSTAPSSLGTPRKLWDLLNILDPTMAARWHWKDDRKVTTSLRVLLETGIKHSDIIAEQQAREQNETHAAEAQVADQTRRLLIWIWRDSDVLYASLDGRVDKMVERGLLNEIRALQAIVRQQANCATGEKLKTDYTRGIYQAIGYKEFDSYLSYLDANQNIDPAEDPQACRLLASALDDMKHATRQYARQQLRWIRNKFGAELQRLRETGCCNTQIVLVDATNPDEWQEKVRNPALAYVKAFLADQKLPPPAQQCTAAVEQLSFTQTSTGTSSRRNPDMHDPLKGNRMTACDVCTTDPAHPVLVREADRDTHARTKRHKSAVRSRERKAAFLEWQRGQTESVAGNEGS